MNFPILRPVLRRFFSRPIRCGVISGKTVALFGSYGWGNQEWMRDWEERVQADGATVLNGEGIAVNGTPGEDVLEECKNAGRGLAGIA